MNSLRWSDNFFNVVTTKRFRPLKTNLQKGKATQYFGPLHAQKGMEKSVAQINEFTEVHLIII